MTESQGPDRCKGSKRAQEFHDELGTLPTDLGQFYQCVCCDPCQFFRPETRTDAHLLFFEHCCRCYPREILLRFIPDNPDGACCFETSAPMLAVPSATFRGVTYTGTMFGVTVTIQLGVINDQCVWTYSATQAGYPVDSGTVTVDDDAVTCLSVPFAIAIPVDGPDGCPGTLVLDDLPRAKLPFVQRELGFADSIGPFVELETESWGACGDCTQVCRLLCVDGTTRIGEGANTTTPKEFVWFDFYGERGWQWAPADDPDYVPERLLLEEDEYGNCMLVPDFQISEAEHYDPEILENCSCALKLDMITQVGGQWYGLSLRCGACTCWEYLCGNCRCIPAELCVLLLTTGDRAVLDWDPDENRWGADTDPVRLYLQRGDADDCVIVPEIDGYLVESAANSFNCGSLPETAVNQVNLDNDFLINFLITDSVSVPLLYVTSTQAGCEYPPCVEATPCNDECGGHPLTLTANFHWWTEPGDAPDPYLTDDCELDVTLHFWQINTTEGPHCGYIGFATLPCATVYPRLEVQLYMGKIRFRRFDPDAGLQHQPSWTEYELDSEACNPYLGIWTHTITLDPLGTFDDWCCEGVGAWRGQITITE